MPVGFDFVAVAYWQLPVGYAKRHQQVKTTKQQPTGNSYKAIALLLAQKAIAYWFLLQSKKKQKTDVRNITSEVFEMYGMYKYFYSKIQMKTCNVTTLHTMFKLTYVCTL